MHTKGKWKLERGRNKHYQPDANCFTEYELLQQSYFYVRTEKHDSDFVADIIVRKSPEGKANARRIVHCCNTHDGLVRALERSLKINMAMMLKLDTSEFDHDIRIVQQALEQAKKEVPNQPQKKAAI